MKTYSVGKLVGYDGYKLVYEIPAPPDYLVERHKYETAEVIISDERTIRPEQRAKIYATIKDIEVHTGDWLNKLTGYSWMEFSPKSDRRSILSGYFKEKYCIDTGAEYFSLSDCSISEARLFCQYLLDFCLENDIELSASLLNRTDDIDTMLCHAIVHKKCILCGINGEIHHWDAIGMGHNRRKVDDSNHRKICLCRKHHREAHAIGRNKFEKKHHVYGIIFKD